MIAKRLEVFGFRNIGQADIDFSPGVNVLIGDNAQGKTNALEAVYIFAGGKSFRAKSDRELIPFGENYGGIRLTMQSSLKRREDVMSFEYISDEGRSSVRRTAKKNGTVERKIGDMLGTFRAVLFCPEHLALVKGGPGERRAFLDIALSQLKPVYLKNLQRFHALLSERNKLLKDAREDRRVFDMTGELWAEQLSECAAYITVTRAEYTDRLSELVKENFRLMTGGKENPELFFRTSAGGDTDPHDEAAVREKYFELYTGSSEREIAAGTTLWGIHRDDIMIELDSKEARLYASQGQDRSIALSMKLSEGEISESISGESPVYLFDDVMSELDESRRAFILSRFDGVRQIIITSCEPEFFRGGGMKIIKVENGRYSSSDNGEA